jgi:dephospho-CoA kinase
LDRNEMVALANEMRKEFGFNYWCKRAIESVNAKDLVITSIRNPSEAKEIKSRGGIIVEVFTSMEVRFERTVARTTNDSNAHGDVESFEDFKAKEERELYNVDPAKQQLLECISMADYRLDNNGTIELLHKGIDKLLGELRAKEH